MHKVVFNIFEKTLIKLKLNDIFDVDIHLSDTKPLLLNTGNQP